MDAVFSFLFGTRTGFAILFAGGILLFAILAFVMEKRTHKLYVDRGAQIRGRSRRLLGLTCQKGTGLFWSVLSGQTQAPRNWN